MNCSNYAMRGISFPFVVLSKSAKVIPVILVGKLRGVYNPSRQQYMIALFITLGLVIFNVDKVSSILFHVRARTMYLEVLQT